MPSGRQIAPDMVDALAEPTTLQSQARRRARAELRGLKQAGRELERLVSAHSVFVANLEAAMKQA